MNIIYYINSLPVVPDNKLKVRILIFLKIFFTHVSSHVMRDSISWDIIPLDKHWLHLWVKLRVYKRGTNYLNKSIIAFWRCCKLRNQLFLIKSYVIFYLQLSRLKGDFVFVCFGCQKTQKLKKSCGSLLSLRFSDKHV